MIDPTLLTSACVARADTLPWVPGGAGKSSKPLRFLRKPSGFVELLRLEPGAEMRLHRHAGTVHALNLEGSRQLGTGEIVGPGEYVYEPPGNTDSWKAVGDTPLVVFVVVTGAVDYLGPDGKVLQRVTAESQLRAYLDHCARMGIAAVDLVDVG